MIQMTFDGHDVLMPLRPRQLNERQRAVLALMRMCGTLRTREVDGGWDMLSRLRKRGLVEPVCHGRWRATEHSEDW